MTMNEHLNIVRDRLLPLQSWTDEEKCSLLNTIKHWISQLKDSIPERLKMNIQCLGEVLGDDILTHAMLSVNTVLEVIQSDDIPAEAWLDCLRAAVLSKMEKDTDYQNTISFDFKPVIIPPINFDRQLCIMNSSTHQNTEYVLVFRSQIKISRYS
jgi:hypothetical protein